MQESFTKTFSYCTYRLQNNVQLYDLTIVSRIVQLVKKLRMQLNIADFVDIDCICILGSLKKFCDACDIVGTHNKAITRLISYFMMKPALSSLEARL